MSRKPIGTAYPLQALEAFTMTVLRLHTFDSSVPPITVHDERDMPRYGTAREDMDHASCQDLREESLDAADNVHGGVAMNCLAIEQKGDRGNETSSRGIRHVEANGSATSYTTTSDTFRMVSLAFAIARRSFAIRDSPPISSTDPSTEIVLSSCGRLRVGEDTEEDDGKPFGLMVVIATALLPLACGVLMMTCKN